MGDPEVRRRGIGRGLIEAATGWARQAGATRAELWITEGNEAGLRLCEKVGFSSTGDTEPLREGSELTVQKFAADL